MNYSALFTKQVKKVSKSKTKKPKIKKVRLLSANEIKNYIRSKFDTENDEFWSWFFSECPWGKTNILDLSNEEIIQPKFKDYFKIIKNDFIPDADEDSCVEIENDL